MNIFFSLMPDYQIHLIAPYGLSDGELKKFYSSLRKVLTFIKYSKDREKMDEAVRDNFKKLRKEILRLALAFRVFKGKRWIGSLKGTG